MDPNFAAGFRHRRSPSSDRFLSVFSPPSPAGESFASAAGDELSELDVFYTADFSDEHRISTSDRRQTERFGILAALQDDRRGAVVQKPALWSPSPASISRDIPAIPKRRMSTEQPKISQSMPARRFQKSAPVNVPMMPRKAVEAFEDEAGEEEEVLPPHEMVARVSLRNEKTTFSVLEGVGRTLKGRDLRQVRNAVWRQTGGMSNGKRPMMQSSTGTFSQEGGISNGNRPMMQSGTGTFSHEDGMSNGKHPIMQSGTGTFSLEGVAGSGRQKFRKGDRSRRIWIFREEEILAATLLDLVAHGWKSDNGFRTGYLTKIEERLRTEFLNCDIRRTPHITSKIGTWKKSYGILRSILSRTGVGLNLHNDFMIDCDGEQ